jgi:membrane protease subunit HflK
MIELEIGGKKVKVPLPGGKSILTVVIVGLALVGLKSSIYTVKTEEEAIVLRFGRFIKTEQPGLRFKLPFGIDRVDFLAVRRQLKQEFGFGTQGSTNPKQWSPPDQQEFEKQMVTGDLNTALVEWIVQYRIVTPSEFLFHVRDPEETLRDAAEAVMREVVGDRTVDEVITVGRQEIESESLAKLKTLVTAYGMGISVDQVQLKNVNPPRPVQASFNEVNQAQQEREKSINVANGQANREIPKARGEAEKLISEAQGYAVQRVNEAEGDVAKFNAMFTEYQKAPEVTKRRIYLETLQTTLPLAGRKIVLDEDAKQVLPLLQLDGGKSQ